MIVADTGPLYALIDRDDAWHRRVAAWWTREPRVIVVPFAVVPEVCCLLHTRISATAELAFVRALADGTFTVEPSEPADITRAAEVMQDYGDTPIGFVDATVIATAERLGAREILTTDRRHFSLVRPRHCAAFTLVP